MNSELYETDRPSAQEEIPGRSLLDSLLVAIRVIASVGAVAAIVFGVVLAAQLYTFFRGIVEHPDTIIVSWQQAMDKGRPTTIPAPTDNPVAPRQRVPETKPVAIVPEPENASAVAPAAVEAPVETPIEVPVKVTVEETGETPIKAPVDKSEARPSKRTGKPEGDLPPFMALANRVMEQVELGEFGWLIGIGFLLIFCWFLLKIPVMLITTGSRLLIAMVNLSAES